MPAKKSLLNLSQLNYLIASISAIGFYGAMFLLFKMDFGVKAGEGAPARHFAEITMLPVEGDVKYQWQRNLLASLELLDPTIMSLPNSSYGFSRIRNLERERPVQGPPRFELELRYASAPPTTRVVLRQPAADDQEVLAVISRRGLLEISGNTRSTPKLEPQAYWIDDDGQMIDWIPKVDDKLAVSSASVVEATGPTIVTITGQNEAFRIVLMQSCNVTELDQAAIRRLGAYLTSELSKIKLNAVVRKALDESLTISIHWRFLPKVHETNRDLKGEIWHGQDWF